MRVLSPRLYCPFLHQYYIFFCCCAAGKRSAPAANGCDSATETDSLTLSDGANQCREREVDSGCRNGTESEPTHRKRQKSGYNAQSSKAGSQGDAAAAGPGSEGGNSMPSSTVPFTLASAAQAAGVWNRSAAKTMLLKSPTMTSATETTHPGPGNTGHITPFEGCDGVAVSKDSAEHADALHRESGPDPISHDHQKIMAAQQQLDLAALLSENTTRKLSAEALQKLLQQVGTGGQVSIHDLVHAVCSSSLLFWYTVCFAGASARHVPKQIMHPLH